MSNFQQNVSKPTILTDWKLRMSGDPIEGSKRRPTLTWGCNKNGVFIKIYTNVDSDKDGGALKCQLDIPTFFVFMGYLQEAIASDGPYKQFIEYSDFDWVMRQRSEMPTLKATVTVGKDDRGMVYLGVLGKDITKVQFPFKVPFLHNLKNAEDGSPVSDTKASVIYAGGYHAALTALAPMVMQQTFVPPVPKAPGGGNGGNFQPQNNNNNGNNYQPNNGGGNGGNFQQNNNGSGNFSEQDVFH